jgi:hypothetical protein
LFLRKFLDYMKTLLQTDADYVSTLLGIIAGIIVFPYGMQRLFGSPRLFQASELASQSVAEVGCSLCREGNESFATCTMSRGGEGLEWSAPLD